MFGFILKKNFCDGWDNLLSLIITNIICTFVTIGFSILMVNAAKIESGFVMAIVFALFCIVISILVFAYGDMAASIANFDSISILDYFKAIPGSLLDGLLFGLLIAAIGILSYVGIGYYWGDSFLSQFPRLGIFLGALLLWMDVFAVLSLQWFLPIRSLMHNNFKKCLKKSFIIFFDNTGFSILIFIYNLILVAISIFFIGMLPSYIGILIGNTNALRIRLYKYDYLEEHPELTTKKERRHIPWEELIYEDRETLGPRKLKSFLFPWKEN